MGIGKCSHDSLFDKKKCGVRVGEKDMLLVTRSQN